MIEKLRIKLANWLIEGSDVDKEMDTVFEYLSDLETSHAKLGRIERNLDEALELITSVVPVVTKPAVKKTVKKLTKK